MFGWGEFEGGEVGGGHGVSPRRPRGRAARRNYEKLIL
jgi:hypothetical protein